MTRLGAMGSDVAGARLALGWLVLGEWRAHPVRIALTALAIAIGVGLGSAVHLVNGSALASFDGAVRSVGGAADVAVEATSPLGFDEALYPRIAMLAGVDDASPVVKLQAVLTAARPRALAAGEPAARPRASVAGTAARPGAPGLTLLGLDLLRAVRVTPSLVGIPAATGRGGDPGDRDAVFAADRVYLSEDAMRDAGVAAGDQVMIGANGRSVPFRVAGRLPRVGEGQRIAVIDIAAAQWRFGRLGRLDRIDVRRATPSITDAALAAALPAGSVIATAATGNARNDALSRAYRVNLDMLALVALLTGGFLVYSAQSLSVARRLRAFALIRTLGLPRGGIVAAVAAEGLAIGIAGALAGLGLGYLVAAVALARFGGDLGAGYFAGGRVALRFAPAAAAAFFAIGLTAAVAGSVFPALAAARAAPAAALRNSGDPVDPRARVAWLPGLLLIVLGGGAALLPAVGELPLFGFAAMALILAGGIAAMPFLARCALGPLARARGGWVPGDLAVRHLHGAPGQAATALCGIVASTALMIAMAVMVTSFRGAVDDWLGQILSADLYLRADRGGGLDPAAQARLAAIPGVAHAAFSRELPLTIAADRPPLVLIARGVGNRGDAPLVLIAGRIDAAPGDQGGRTPVWVSEPASLLFGWHVGDGARLPIPGHFVVAGVWRDYARQQGAVVIRTADYVRATGDRQADDAAITLLPGRAPAAVARALGAATPGPGVTVIEPGPLRRFALALFDRSFAVTYVLEGVAILVGLAGIAATMSAQTLARTREFGMLRHIGVSRRQITAMLASEGALLGAIGAVAGIALGGVMARVLVDVINPQSFHWTMSTRVPWGTIAGVAASLVVAASATAVLAGRRALGMEAVRMVRDDW